MPTRNINLTEHMDRFIETSVKSGKYGNASEAVRDGLRLLEQREKEDRAKLKWLRDAVKKGLDELNRGEGIAFHSIDDLETAIHQLGEDVSGELAAERRRV